MKIETIGGALLASIILFITGFMALLQTEGVASYRDISEVSWWILAGGASLSFLKDYQALTARKFIGGLTGSE